VILGVGDRKKSPQKTKTDAGKCGGCCKHCAVGKKKGKGKGGKKRTDPQAKGKGYRESVRGKTATESEKKVSLVTYKLGRGAKSYLKVHRKS